MAEIRLRPGRGLCDFAQKARSCYLLGSQWGRRDSAAQLCCVSAAALGDIHGRDPCEAEKDTVTPRTGTVDDVHEKEKVRSYFYHIGHKEYSLSKETRVQSVGGNNWYPGKAKCRRKPCTSSLLVFIREYSGNGTRPEPLYKTKTGYYEVLRVSPSATQAQIKTAYYKQSFVYHPDRNAGSEEATVRFSEISEAYMVLGNKMLRKKYDRGLLSQADLIVTPRPHAKDATGSSAKQQTSRRWSVVGGDNRGGIFDFDKFYKSHYGEQLQRERDIRVRKEEMLKKKQETIGQKKMGRMMEMGVAVLLAMAVGLVISAKRP